MRTAIRHRRFPQRAAHVVVLAALVAAALAVTGSASARGTASKAVCWRKVMNDWYDNGRIDGSYSIACYKAALKHLPRDVRTYSDAYDVMSRALASATKKKNANDNTVIPPPGGPGNGGSGGGSGPSSGPPSGGDSGPNPPLKEPQEGGAKSAAGGSQSGFLNEATDSLGSDRADSVPVPLLVLAGLALLLVAAGAAGLIARRVQARRARP